MIEASGLTRRDAVLVALPLRVECAWCGAEISKGALPVSHGICIPCCVEVFGFYPDAESPPPALPLLRRFLSALFGLVALLVVALPTALHAQVAATTELRNGVAELRVGNPTTAPVSVELSLFRDATTGDGPVTLGDSVSALISPQSFTLQPGDIQVIRIRVREIVEAGELLRLATLFTPFDAEPPKQGVRLLVRTRVVSKVKVVAQ